MLADLIHVFAYASLPVAIVSFLLIYWSISQGYVGSGDEDSDEVSDKETKQSHEKTHEEFHKEVEKMAEDFDEGKLAKKSKTDPKNIVFEKWLTFGGGFYGVVALITYLIVEWDEVVDLFTGGSNIITAITSFDIGFFIRFFIDSIMNLVTAFAWPAYWMGRVDGPAFWVWFLAAWFGYEAGARAARIYYEERQFS